METQKSIVIMNLNVSDAIINHAFMDEFHECGGYLLGKVVEKDSLKYFYVTQIYYEKNIIVLGRRRGLRNVYLAGQWLQAPGGLPNAAVTGKFAIQRLLHDHKELII